MNVTITVEDIDQETLDKALAVIDWQTGAYTVIVTAR